MGIKDELLFDFSINMPRILVSGRTGVIDHVKKLVMVSQKSIIADTGSMFTVVNGDDLVINQLDEERMLITGYISTIEFYRGQTPSQGNSAPEGVGP